MRLDLPILLRPPRTTSCARAPRVALLASLISYYVLLPLRFRGVEQNLVESLLLLEPSERLGSEKLGGIAGLKKHQFFSGLPCAWSDLHNHKPPELDDYLPAMADDEAALHGRDNADQDIDDLIAQVCSVHLSRRHPSLRFAAGSSRHCDPASSSLSVTGPRSPASISMRFPPAVRSGHEQQRSRRHQKSRIDHDPEGSEG